MACLAGALLAGVQTSATASRLEDRPELSPIHATFDEELRLTTYEVRLTNPDPSTTVWRWDFTPPPDDTSCNNFSVATEAHDVSTAGYLHGDQNGCHHSGTDHNVDIEVTAVTGPYTCNATIHGTTPHDGPTPEPCFLTNGTPPPPPPPPPPPSAPPPKLTPDEKSNLRFAAAASAGFGVVTGIGAIVLTFIPSPDPLTKGGAGFCYLAAAGEFGIAAAALHKAKDPPDPNYKQLARLGFPRWPVAKPGPGLTKQEVAAENALATNTTRVVGYDTAFLTSLERAQGANAAGDGDWDRVQSHAAAGFARAEAKLLDARPPLEAALRQAFESAVTRVQVSVADARKAAGRVFQSGLPPSFVSLLRAFGLSTQEIASVRTQMAGVAPSKVAGDLAAKLAVPAQAAAERKSAGIVRQIAARLEKR